MHDADMQRNIEIVEKCKALGEPFFVMRAQDCLASALVTEWATRAENAGVHDWLVSHARMIARNMRLWPKKKIPD
jgi:hypothetical protein